MSTTDESLVAERTRFRGPPAPDPLDPAATTISDPTPPDPEPEPEGRRSRWRPGPARAAATSTSTSSSDRPPAGDRRDVARGMAEALVGLLVFAALGARALLAGRGVEVMLPTEDERRAIAAPLGRIGARHVPLELAPAVIHDLVDLGECAGAVHAYTEGAARRRRTGELPQPAPQPDEESP